MDVGVPHFHTHPLAHGSIHWLSSRVLASLTSISAELTDPDQSVNLHESNSRLHAKKQLVSCKIPLSHLIILNRSK